MTQWKYALPDGLTVRYTHEREAVVSWDGRTRLMTYWQAKENEAWLHPRGGRTIARLFDEDKVVVAEGVAVCSSRDNFCKRLGRQISLGRCLDALRSSENAREEHA